MGSSTTLIREGRPPEKQYRSCMQVHISLISSGTSTRPIFWVGPITVITSTSEEVRLTSDAEIRIVHWLHNDLRRSEEDWSRTTSTLASSAQRSFNWLGTVSKNENLSNLPNNRPSGKMISREIIILHKYTSLDGAEAAVGGIRKWLREESVSRAFRH